MKKQVVIKTIKNILGTTTYVNIEENDRLIDNRIFTNIYDWFEQRVRYDEYINEYKNLGYDIIYQN